MSADPIGFLVPALAVGVGSILIKPRRGFFPQSGNPIIAQAVVEEHHEDVIEITDHPVEFGAAVSDQRPSRCIVRGLTARALRPTAFPSLAQSFQKGKRP